MVAIAKAQTARMRYGVLTERGELHGGCACSDEDEDCTEFGRDGCCRRVEEAGEVDARCGGLGPSQRSDVRIDGYLKERESAADNEEREQEERIEDDHRSRNEEEQTQTHHCQREDNALFVANSADNPTGRKRHYKIGYEETELDEQSALVRKTEQVFEVLNKNVVQRGDKAYSKVKRNHQDQRNGVVLAAGAELR